MSAKNAGTHQGRRTPLSLNTGIPKLQSQNQKGQAAANTNGNTQKEAQQQQLNFKTKKERQQERQQERQRELANAKNHENKSTENGHKAANGGEKPAKQQNGKEKFDKNAAETVAAAVAAKDKDTTKAENVVTVIEVDNDKPEKQSGEQKDKKSEESVPMPASEKIETNGGTPSKTIPTIDLVEDDAMDVTEETNAAKPVGGGSVTPKRATRTKTPTPKKSKADKMSMSPTVVLTRADKAAVEAANATVSSAETNVTEPESTIQQNTAKTPEKQVVVEEAAEDDLMESIQVEPSPIKSPAQEKVQAPVQQAPSSSSVTNPSATSTPGKYSSRFTYSLADSHVPVVGGRRSIHPINEKYIDRYQSIRESYRRINTELDVTSDTNTSMNVTVGSEIPNNSSFSSFFSRGNRKRDRTPSNLSLNEDVKRELVTSPPKRARFEGFMHLVASPITLLRSRFSRASIQNRVPTRIDAHLDQEEEEIDDNVQNLSGGDENMPPPATDNEPAAAGTKDEVAAAATEKAEVSVEDITIAEEAKASDTPKKDAAPTATTDIGAAGDAKEKTDVDISKQDGAEGAAETTAAADSNSNDDDIQIVERQKKGCVIM